ncbi:MAG: coproporphyrinogen III oxidase, partial [Roseimicrobium sp.]
ESEDLDDRQWLMERVALELRTADGLAESRLQASVLGRFQTLLDEHLVQCAGGRITLTRSGKAVCDRVAEMLLPDD